MKLKQFMVVLFTLALAIPSLAAPVGPHLERLVAEGKGNFAGGTFAKSFERVVNGKVEMYAHVFIDAERAAIPALAAHGAEINTVTDSGVMTAVVPVAKLHSIAAVAGVRKISAGQAVKKFMDLSAAAEGVNLPDTSFPRDENTGEGVIVGVIDTGIDIEHPDFIDDNGDTRILSIWDHTLDPEDVGGMTGKPMGFSYGTEWSYTQINQGYDGCLHRDKDGHGTHVAGTAAGNGSAAHYKHSGPYTGLAPEAELLIVKFDFDNEKDRNSDTAILDAINWIFQKAAAEGKPCVINMSLGSDYGPHDGSTAEERGIDDLTGAGKVVVVAAGNAGTSYDGNAFETWGAPIHGSGNSLTGNDIVIETSSDHYMPDQPESPDDYLFFDVWYPGTDRCRVQVTTPSGLTYPPSMTGRNRNLWVTDGTSGGFATPEGTIYVENVSGAASFWGTENGDNNLYIEISDASGTNPAEGKWIIEIIPLEGSGEYQAWHGYSTSLAQSYFWYDSGTDTHDWGDFDDSSLSDNMMTIGKPATAFSAISIGAYQTKTEWPARQYQDWTDPESTFSFLTMAYGDEPITYYDPFVLHDIAFFSSRGPSRDGRVQPFIAAPGVGIVASLSQTVLNDPEETYFRSMNRVEFEGYYCTLQGTSMAAPHGTGSVALLLEEAADNGIAATPDDVKAYLKDGARKDGYTGLDASDPESANHDWGYGKIDVSSSLELVEPSVVIPPTVTGCVPNIGRPGQRLTVNVSGNNFQLGAEVSFGQGIAVQASTVVSQTVIECQIRIDRKAVPGQRDVTVTNPDTGTGTLTGGFVVLNK